MKLNNLIIPLVLSLTFTALAYGQTENTEMRDSLQTITIKQSGFMKADEISITFRSDDQQIVEVVDKGEKVPEEKFHNYRGLLYSYLELRNIEFLKPRIEKLRQEVLSKQQFRQEEISRMVEVELKLDSIRARLERENSRRADRLLEETLRMERQMAEVRERHLEVTEKEMQIQIFLQTLETKGIIEDSEDVKIEFRKGICTINGKKVSKETMEQIKDIYQDIFDDEINDTRFILRK